MYLLASKRNGTLYTGVTSNLVKRVWEHKHHTVEGFTSKYCVNTLVWYEVHEMMESVVLHRDVLMSREHTEVRSDLSGKGH